MRNRNVNLHPEPHSDRFATRVELGDGATHFLVEGPDDGTPIVLLHGATVPSWQFDRVTPLLVAAGFRILRFDFYGHGLSSAALPTYTPDLFVRQTLELIEAIRFPRPAVLVGHSLGAAIASGVAARAPEAFAKVVLNAPLLGFDLEPRWSRALRCPGIGELLMRYVGIPLMIRRRTARYTSIGVRELAERFREQASYARLGRATLSMLRNGTLRGHGERYGALARIDREVMVIWGEHDPVIRRGDIESIRARLGRHTYIEIDGAQHSLLLTHPEQVVSAVVEFARGNGQERVFQDRF